MHRGDHERERAIEFEGACVRLHGLHGGTLMQHCQQLRVHVQRHQLVSSPARSAATRPVPAPRSSTGPPARPRARATVLLTTYCWPGRGAGRPGGDRGLPGAPDDEQALRPPLSIRTSPPGRTTPTPQRTMARLLELRRPGAVRAGRRAARRLARPWTRARSSRSSAPTAPARRRRCARSPAPSQTGASRLRRQADIRRKRPRGRREARHRARPRGPRDLRRS